ncbi:MAG: hypothetical protein IT470_04000 [Pseudomonadales bacterium]|nr:hypothetical protein [Pseudomonadales bacterium]
MNKVSVYRFHVGAVLLLLVMAAVARINNTLLDFNSLLTSYLADDAFYYFKIAANLATQQRITYDGEQLSNGFHPLWLALITPFYTAADDGIAFVYRVQWLMFAVDLLAVIALYVTVLRLQAGALIAWMATAIFCVHSSFIDMQMNGLETSLNTLLLLLLLNAFITVYQPDRLPWQRYMYFGVMAGMTFLTRTDNAIVVLVLFSAWLWDDFRHSFRHLSVIVISGVVALLVVLPWLSWNWMHFGSLVQGSGKIETIYWGEPQFSWRQLLVNLLLLPGRLYTQLQAYSRLFVLPLQSAGVLAVGCLIFATAALVCLWRARFTSVRLRAVAIFCLGVFAVFCYHAGFRSFVRSWYYVPVALAMLLLLAGVSARWEFVCRQYAWALRGRVVSAACWLLCFSAVLWAYSPLKLTGTVQEPSIHTVAAQWIDANTPPDAVIGSMNSGILSYLVHRKVINLDGVVDARSMRAHWDKRQPEYIHERGIRYLVDNDGALQFFCRDNPLHYCETVFVFGDVRNRNKVVKIVDK